MDKFKKVLESNKNYWKLENRTDDDRGLLLYENFYDTPQLCYGISKVALSIAKSLDLKPAVIMSWRENDMTKSMCETRFQLRERIIPVVFRHLWKLSASFFVNREKLLKLEDGRAKLGSFIYDSILIKYKKKTVQRLSLRDRMFVVLQMCYYFYFKEIFAHNHVRAVVLGDNVYRYGLIFELCRLNNVKCFTPINLNSLFIKKFTCALDYKQSYLNKDLVNDLCKDVDYNAIISDYYDRRYKGKIEQHDVLTAYGNKHVTGISEFEEKYHLDSRKKTVVIMSHVFADAPHVYLNTLYDDYWEWFVNSLHNLLKNPNINLLVKEHPSAHLYGQKGLIKEYLHPLNLDSLLIDDNESTESILNNADVVVTCGGTIGMEFSYRGKNVVLASYPPFGRLGFTTEFDDRENYELFLREKIHLLQPLSKEQMEMARKVSYIVFCLQDNSPKDLEIGGDSILRGKEYDDNILFDNILKYNKTPFEEQRIYKMLDSFVHSGHNALFKQG